MLSFCNTGIPGEHKLCNYSGNYEKGLKIISYSKHVALSPHCHCIVVLDCLLQYIIIFRQGTTPDTFPALRTAPCLHTHKTTAYQRVNLVFQWSRQPGASRPSNLLNHSTDATKNGSLAQGITKFSLGYRACPIILGPDCVSPSRKH
jgi:hypothetical protein